jgi:hypothetical protein
MKYRFLLWQDKLLLLTLIVFFYAYSSPIRVALRAGLEGSEFSWGYASGVRLDGQVAMAHGHGFYGHSDYILFIAFSVAWLLCAGLRKPDAFFRAGIAIWTSIGFGVGLWLTFALGTSLTSNKDTLGATNLSYFWTEVAPAGLAWVLALALLIRSRRAPPPPPTRWTRINTMLNVGAAAFFTLAAILLNAGPPHGDADFNGVGMLYIGLMLLLLGAAPWERQSDSGAHVAVGA